MQYKQIILLGLGLIGNTFAAVSIEAGKIEQKKEATVTLKFDKVCSNGKSFAPATKVVVNYPNGITKVVPTCKSGCTIKAPAKLRRRADPVEKSVEFEKLGETTEATFKFLAPAFDTKNAAKNTIEFNLDITCGEGYTMVKDSGKAKLEITEKDPGNSGSMTTYSTFTFFGLAAAYYL